MNAPRGSFKREILNDVDPNVTRTLKALRDRPERLLYTLKSYPYSEESFKKAISLIGHRDDVKHAAAYIVGSRFSSGGTFGRFATQDRLRGGRMGDENAWINFTEKHIFNTIERLQGVEIRTGCALKLMRRLLASKGAADTLWFLDPPYMHETRVTTSAYAHEVDEWHHRQLLSLVTSNPGRFYICGYYSELYDDVLVQHHMWNFRTFDRPSDAGRTATKSRRTECLWFNHP